MDVVSVAPQKTLKAAIHCRGVALHSGGRVGMTLHPAAPNTGIVFRRADLAGAELRADWRKSAVLHGAADCTGCSLCAVRCPFAAISMRRPSAGA